MGGSVRPYPRPLKKDQPADLAHLKEGILIAAESGPMSSTRLTFADTRASLADLMRGLDQAETVRAHERGSP